MSHLTNEMLNIYSTATVTDASGREYRLDPDLTEVMSTSRDYDRLLWAWRSWRDATGPQHQAAVHATSRKDEPSSH